MVSKMMLNFQEELKTETKEIFQTKLNELFYKNNLVYITYLKLEKIFYEFIIAGIIEDPVEAFLEDYVIKKSLTNPSVYSVLLAIELYKYENIDLAKEYGINMKNNYFEVINPITTEVIKYVDDFETKEEELIETYEVEVVGSV